MGAARVLTLAIIVCGAVVALSFRPEARPVLDVVILWLSDFWDLFGPGGKLHPASFIEHSGHLVVEGALLVVISVLLLQTSFKPKSRDKAELTEKEVQELCDEWQPEPLHGPLTKFQQLFQVPVISSDTGPYVVANGKRVLNCVSFNFLGAAGNAEVKDKCHSTIEKYGVGACGPRGFYGTIDVHLQLEERLACFMGTEESILYSYDMATLPSIIPAFANRKDVIVCDEGVNFSIQAGCNLSRAQVVTFKHNDVADLERVLKRIGDQHRRQRKPLNRRFIVVEGLYANYGDIAPLDRIWKLKEEYKYRLIVDESMSLGVLGETGRGAVEHFGFQPKDVEIVAATIGNSLASVGGFCAGNRDIVDHQRLSGLGYCFSAALPPYLATAAIGAIDLLEAGGPALLQQLRGNAQLFRQQAATLPGLAVVGGKADAASPVVHLALDPPPAGKEEYDDGDVLLQRVVDDSLANEGVLFAVAKYSQLEKSRPPPSIRVALSAAHGSKDIEKAIAALRRSCKRVFK